MKEKKRASNTSSRFSLLMGLNVSIFFSNISPKIKECTVLHVLTWGFGIQKLDQDYPQAKETPISSYTTTQISMYRNFCFDVSKIWMFLQKNIKVSEFLVLNFNISLKIMVPNLGQAGIYISRQGTAYLKSDNLQYHTLVCWDKWLVDQVSDIFFHIFLQNSLQTWFQFIFLFFINLQK